MMPVLLKMVIGSYSYQIGDKYMEKVVKIQRRLHMGFGLIDCVLVGRTGSKHGISAAS